MAQRASCFKANFQKADLPFRKNEDTWSFPEKARTPISAFFSSADNCDDVTSIIFRFLPVPLSIKTFVSLKSCATNRVKISMSPEGDLTVIDSSLGTFAAHTKATNFVSAFRGLNLSLEELSFGLL